MFYVVFLFQQAGIGNSQDSTLIASGVSYVINVVMTVPAILFVDKWGRRPTLIFGALAMSAFLWIVGGLLTTGDWFIQMDPAQSNYGKWSVILPNVQTTDAVVAFVYLFVAAFATTWGPVSLKRNGQIHTNDDFFGSWGGFILQKCKLKCQQKKIPPNSHVSHRYPLRVRAMAISLSTAANWFFNWLLSFVVPMMMERLRFGLYFLFAAFNFLMALHIWLCYP